MSRDSNKMSLKIDQSKGLKTLTLQLIRSKDYRIKGQILKLNKKIYSSNVDQESICYIQQRPRTSTTNFGVQGVRTNMTSQTTKAGSYKAKLTPESSRKRVVRKSKERPQNKMMAASKLQVRVRLRSVKESLRYNQRLVVIPQNIFSQLFFKLAYVNEVKPPEAQKLLAYVGPGNNSALIKSLLKQRGYSLQAKPQKRVNLIWTQSKQSDVIESQPKYNFEGVKFLQIAPEERLLSRGPFTTSENVHIDKLLQSRTKPKMEAKRLEGSVISNHLQSIGEISTKRGLFLNISKYCLHFKIPLEFIIPQSILIQSQADLQAQISKLKLIDYWIAKPPQDSNRGNGIIVGRGFQYLKKVIALKRYKVIVQKYIRPLLYQKRKFDIRHYMLITSFAGNIRVYWCSQGYIRTSSYLYEQNDNDPGIHLTNDAVQKDYHVYGKYQKANKVSYRHMERYIGQQKFGQILNQMKNQALLAVKSSVHKLDPNARQSNFQLLGLDFMIDQSYHPLLIQVNQNPCLQVCCPLLQRLIPRVVDESMRLAVDWCYKPKFPEEKIQLWTLLWTYKV